VLLNVQMIVIPFWIKIKTIDRNIANLIQNLIIAESSIFIFSKLFD